jgi:hypothetical protein
LNIKSAFYVICEPVYEGCGARSPEGMTENNTIELWNRRFDKENLFVT